jgi:lipopolysaccharide export system permease protein
LSNLAIEMSRRSARSQQTPQGLFKIILGVFLRLETRFVVILYLQRVTILALVTISIVVALDISANIDAVMNTGNSVQDRLGLARLLYYSLLRMSFVAPSVLLFAGVWGVVWAEYSLATSRERIMLFNCGRSYIPSLVPALLVGCLVGLLHFAISGYLKPATVELEATTTHRSYGLKFDRPAASGIEWIAGTDFILRGRVEISTDVGLKDVYAFVYGENANLEFIVRAARASPAPNTDRWTFFEGTVSYFPTISEGTNSGQRPLDETRFERLDTELQLSPLWLENFGILPILLPQPLVNMLIEQGQDVPNLYKYKMTAYERYASILYCIATVLLSAHLAMTRFRSDMMPYRALSVAVVGFAAYFFFSISLMLGHHGYIPVLIAAWSIPLMTITMFAAAVYSYVRK